MRPPGRVLRQPPGPFAAVPLMSRGRRGGGLRDNLFREPITEEDIQLLTMFASNACLAMENASLYQSLQARSNHPDHADGWCRARAHGARGDGGQVAHEIRTPHSDRGFAGRSPPPRPGEARVPRAGRAIILKEVERMERIINGRSTSPGDWPRVPHRKPEREIREVLWMFREELEETRSPRWSTSHRTCPHLGDPDQIRQVWNLSRMHQAIGRAASSVVTQSRSAEGTGVVLEVSDTGGGIPHDVCTTSQPFLHHEGERDRPRAPHRPAIVGEARGDDPSGQPGGGRVAFSIFLPLFPKEAGTGDRFSTDAQRRSGWERNRNASGIRSGGGALSEAERARALSHAESSPREMAAWRPGG